MQEEIRYRREVLGMPDKYFHKMGTLQVIIISSIITMSDEHLDQFGETKTDQRLSLCSLQWDYNRELAQLGGFKPLPDAIENLYMSVRRGLIIKIMG